MISFAINKLSPTNRRQSDQLSVRLKWHPYLRLGTYSPPSRRRITFRCKRRRFVLDATDVRSNVELHPRQIHVDHTSGYFNARDDKTTHINIRRRRRTATNDCCLGQSFYAYLHGPQPPPPCSSISLLAVSASRHASSWGPPTASDRQNDDGRCIRT